MRIIKLAGKIGILIIALSTLSACVVAGDGVVTAVESFYVSSKKEVLVISGNTAAHPLYGSFTVDNPVALDKKYKGEDGATLVFRTRNGKLNATIESGGSKSVFEFMNYGGPEKATVFGVYW